jgi:hypothetical protein
MALPSYDSIYLRDTDIGALIVPYLDVADLNNILLVNKESYLNFARYLWNDPLRSVVRRSKPFST